MSHTHGKARVPKMRNRPLENDKKLRLTVVDDLSALEESEAPHRAKKAAIPTPPITLVPGYAKRPYTKFDVPPHYVKMHINTLAGLIPPEVRYDLMAEDVQWLKAFNEQQRDLMPLTEDEMESMIDLFEKKSFKIQPFVTDASVRFPYAEASYAATSMNPELARKPKGVEGVYGYWIKKRKKIKKPLMRPFQAPPDADDTSPHVAFRPRFGGRRISTRNPRKNDLASLLKMQQLRRDFEFVLKLLDRVRMRELMKRDVIVASAQLFDEQLAGTAFAQKYQQHEVKPPHTATTPEQKIASMLRTNLPDVDYQKDLADAAAQAARNRPINKATRAQLGAIGGRPQAGKPTRGARGLRRKPDRFETEFLSDDSETGSEDEEDRAFFAAVDAHVGSIGEARSPYVVFDEPDADADDTGVVDFEPWQGPPPALPEFASLPVPLSGLLSGLGYGPRDGDITWDEEAVEISVSLPPLPDAFIQSTQQQQQQSQGQNQGQQESVSSHGASMGGGHTHHGQAQQAQALLAQQAQERQQQTQQGPGGPAPKHEQNGAGADQNGAAPMESPVKSEGGTQRPRGWIRPRIGRGGRILLDRAFNKYYTHPELDPEAEAQALPSAAVMLPGSAAGAGSAAAANTGPVAMTDAPYMTGMSTGTGTGAAQQIQGQFAAQPQMAQGQAQNTAYTSGTGTGTDSTDPSAAGSYTYTNYAGYTNGPVGAGGGSASTAGSYAAAGAAGGYGYYAGYSTSAAPGAAGSVGAYAQSQGQGQGGTIKPEYAYAPAPHQYGRVGTGVGAGAHNQYTYYQGSPGTGGTYAYVSTGTGASSGSMQASAQGQGQQGQAVLTTAQQQQRMAQYSQPYQQQPQQHQYSYAGYMGQVPTTMDTSDDAGAAVPQAAT